MRPTALIELMNTAMDAVTVAFDGLTEEQWSTATDCPGWDVKDNLSHLIGTELFLMGKPSTTHRAPKFDYVKNPIGEANEHDVVVWQSPRIVVLIRSPRAARVRAERAGTRGTGL